jgi:hypothetical protein
MRDSVYSAQDDISLTVAEDITLTVLDDISLPVVEDRNFRVQDIPVQGS